VGWERVREFERILNASNIKDGGQIEASRICLADSYALLLRVNTMLGSYAP
jgi:hypothetical protein